MRYSRSMRSSVFILILALLLAGCGGSMLRDDYMGMSVLQPDKLPRAVERDAHGNPILDEDDGPPAEQ